MFKTNKINIGTFRVGMKVNISFIYENIHTIKEMKSSCGCSVPENNESRSCVDVTYTAQPIPKHLEIEGKTNYSIYKNITVVYSTKDTPDSFQTSVLEIVGTITK